MYKCRQIIVMYIICLPMGNQNDLLMNFLLYYDQCNNIHFLLSSLSFSTIECSADGEKIVYCILYFRQVNHTVQCVWSNVQPQCGHKAAELATILVKPMVRHSTKCDNKVTTKAVSKSTTVVSFQTNWS